jgi:hypothetical protein
MTGTVSTENNGGFIQMRLDLPPGAAAGATGVRLIVRGNSQRYFVHLRTSGTRLPWQYYQAGFEVGPDWAEVRLPLEAFRPSGAMLARVPAGRAADLAGCRGLWARPRRRDRRGRGRILLTRHRSSGRSGEDLISSIDRSAVTVWIFTSPIRAW